MAGTITTSGLDLENRINITVPESGVAVNHFDMVFCKAGILHSKKTLALSRMIAILEKLKVRVIRKNRLF